MSWDYRVVHSVDHDEDIYQIHEIYYSDSGEIRMWTERPVTPFGNSLNELIHDIALFGEAHEKPVLEKSELPNA